MRLDYKEVNGIRYWCRVKEDYSADLGVILGVVKRGLLKSTLELPEGSIVFDVGAHIGAWCLPLWKARPDLRIYAFEPEPFNYTMLLRNIIENDSNISAIPYGIFPTVGRFQLMGRPNNTGAWSCNPVSPIDYDWDMQVQVFGTDMDNALRNIGQDHVNYLKIDTEGLELQILKSIDDSIYENIIGMDIENHREDHLKPIKSLLRSKGFTVEEPIEYVLEVTRDE